MKDSLALFEKTAFSNHCPFPLSQLPVLLLIPFVAVEQQHIFSHAKSVRSTAILAVRHMGFQPMPKQLSFKASMKLNTPTQAGPAKDPKKCGHHRLNPSRCCNKEIGMIIL